MECAGRSRVFCAHWILGLVWDKGRNMSDKLPKFVQLLGNDYGVFGLDVDGVVWLYRSRVDADNSEWNNGCEWRPLRGFSEKPDHVATAPKPEWAPR